MFDSMALSEKLSDMHSVGMIDDSLYLIKALNKNITILDAYQEKIMIDSLQTGSNCPRAFMYLDLGICPARFQIKNIS